MQTAGDFFKKQLTSKPPHHHKAGQDGPAWTQDAGIGWLLLKGSSSDTGLTPGLHTTGPTRAGGKAPAVVREESKPLEVARSFFDRSKPVAAICHGPHILISAGLLKGRRATCYMSVADELKTAGALYEDREVVVDGNLVTSRQPPDLPAFMRETMKLLGI